MSGIGDRRGASAVTYVALVIAGWGVSNLLLSIGVVFVLFAMFANGTASGFFAEAESLARHFAAASMDRRESFLMVVRCFVAVVFLMVCAFRARALLGLLGIGGQAQRVGTRAAREV